MEEWEHCGEIRWIPPKCTGRLKLFKPHHTIRIMSNFNMKYKVTLLFRPLNIPNV